MTASGLTITLMAIAALAAWVSTAEGGGWPPPREAAAEGSRARVVARHALRADTVLTAEDLAVTGGAEASDPRARMVGLRLRHPIAAGSPVGQRDLAAPFLVRRNERVRIVFSTGALTITGVGRAMEDAPLGGVIPVMNAGSRRLIDAMVVGRGRVEALLR